MLITKNISNILKNQFFAVRHSTMKVLLIENLNNRGLKGDIVKAKINTYIKNNLN
jgi:hypothetical protein